MKSRIQLLIAPVFIAASVHAALPPVPVPPENPITPEKRVLGKILFFEEQMSVDGTMSCATCHTMTAAATDPRRARNPGLDGLLNTPDDIVASPGVIRSDSFENYLRDAVFGTAPQITGRTANSPINAAYSVELFWDGRARSQFVDPETGQVLIASGGALESQIVNPPVSSVEMGHDGIVWSEVTGNLSKARPLALATNIPPDVSAALTGNPSYPELFRRAFGDTTISAARIAFAIATYERTLIADQTPFDLGTLTTQQQQGLQRMGPGIDNCTACHTPPMFSTVSSNLANPRDFYRNIGLRPPTEDPGRRNVTNDPLDRGRMKVPSLRNVGLKNNFMHNGQFTTLQQVFGFYDRAPGTQQFPDNQDPIMVNVRIPPTDGALVQDFLTNGLRDPRVAAGTFPFDAPTLYTQRAGDRPALVGGGVPGSGGIIPNIIAISPPLLGSQDFRIGLDRSLGGTSARLMISTNPPVNGRITPTWTFQTQFVPGAGAGNGLVTHHWPLTGGGASAGQTIWAQWSVDDAAAAGGQSFSSIARIRFFCSTAGCPTCLVDFSGDGTTSVEDLFQFLAAYFAGDIRADFNASHVLTVQDIFDFLAAYFAGCA